MRAAADTLRLPAFQRRDKPDVAFHREMGEESNFLDDITDAPPQTNRVPLGRRTSFNQNFALGRLEQPVDELEGGGLTGAAAAQ